MAARESRAVLKYVCHGRVGRVGLDRSRIVCSSLVRGFTVSMYVGGTDGYSAILGCRGVELRGAELYYS